MTNGCRKSIFLDIRIQLFILFLSALFIIFTKLDKGELAGLDDCYYAEKAKEILSTGSWMTMHYAGGARFDNPPFFIWLQAGMFKLFGANEYTARFPSAIFGLGTIILVFIFGRMWYGTRTGVYSVIVMLTTQFFLKYARRGMMDVTLAFLVVLALYFFWKSYEKKWYTVGFGLSVAAAILTKSVLGLFPILIAGAYLLFSKNRRRLFSQQFLLGSAIGICIGASWFIYEFSLYGSVFLQKHFGWLIVARTFKTNAQEQHWYSYLWYLWKLVEHYSPWIFVAAYGIYGTIRKRISPVYKPDILLLCWIGVIIGLMSIANEKKVWYIMPAFPAFAIICGKTLDGIITTDTLRTRFMQAAFGIFACASIVFAATPVRLDTNRHPDLKIIAHYTKVNTPEVKRILNYRIAYWINRSVLLFYSDADLSETIEDIPSLKQQLSDTVYMPVLTDERKFPDIASDTELIVQPLIKQGSFMYCKIKKKL